MQILSPCQVDLFASRISTQLPKYMSWKPDPGAIATDVLSQPWKDIKGYAFPPFALIGRCLSKVQRERVKELILITPVLPTQPWLAVPLSMLFQRPILLPKLPSLLLTNNNESHPLIHQLNLAAWPISEIALIIKEFQAKQQLLSYLPGEKPLKVHTHAVGEDGSNGVPQLDIASSIHVPISTNLDFHARQFAEGKQYQTINSYRSAISMTHTLIDGAVVGKHPLVTRLMKGVFNRRPPQPRYAFTCDVGTVIEYVCFFGRNSDVSLKQLSHKLVVLLALSNASRASEIHALDIRYLSRNDDGITFAIAELTKTAQPGKKEICLVSSSDTGR